MQFSVFEITRVDHVDLEWLYSPWEDRCDEMHWAYLVDAKNSDAAKKKVAEWIFSDTCRGPNGIRNIVDMAFEGLRGLAGSGDGAVVDYLGVEDGHVAIDLFDRYALDQFIDRKILFSDLSDADQESFAVFDVESLKRLFVDETKHYLKATPITKFVK